MFGVNQHVILPYQNISEVIIEAESGASKTARIINNTLAVATVAFALFAFVNIGGGTYTFIEKRPTVIVIDDAGNAYQIDCAETDWFLEKLAEKMMNLK